MAQTPLSPNRIGGMTSIGLTTFESGITAAAGGTQAAAYQLSAQVNQVATCATAADSVALPKINLVKNRPGFLGFVCVVQNAGAAACQVYGGTGALDTINGVATATGVSIPIGGTGLFIASTYAPSTDVGNWVGAITDTFDSVVFGSVTASSIVVSGSASIGASATALVRFYGATGVAQAAAIASALTTGLGTALVGFATTAQAQSWADSINAALTALRNLGLIATSA